MKRALLSFGLIGASLVLIWILCTKPWRHSTGAERATTADTSDGEVHSVAQAEDPSESLSRSVPQAHSAVFVLTTDTGVIADGANVKCHDLATGNLHSEGLSDERGEFSLEGEYPASVMLEAVWEDAGAGYAAVQEFELEPGGCRKSLTLTRDSLALCVLVLANSKPAPDVGVVVSDGQRVQRDATDGAGLVKFAELAPGYAILSLGERRSLYIRERLDTWNGRSLFHVVRLPAGVLRVQLISELGGLAALGGREVSVQPVPNLLESMDRHQPTDDQGQALFDHLAPGNYLVSVGHRVPFDLKPDEAALAPAFASIEMHNEQVTLQLELVHAVTLRIKVVGEATGYPVPAGVLLTVPDVGLINNWRHPRIYLSSPEYQEFAVPPGELHVFAINNVHGWGKRSVHGVSGETLTCELVLARSGPSFRVEVYGEKANRVDAAWIYDDRGGLVYRCAKSIESAGLQGIGPGASEREGNSEAPVPELPGYSAAVPSLPAGEYTIICTDGEERIAEGSITLTQDAVLKLYAR